jgi:isopenicillin N synthase-like dioxygenase
MDAPFAVPIIDLTAYVTEGNGSGREAVARAVDEANSTVGFFQVRGHGISDATIAELASAMDVLFALDSVDKARYRAPAAVNRGYTPPRSESLSLSLGIAQPGDAYDTFEAFNVGAEASSFPRLDLPAAHYPENIWPDLERFRPAVEAYFAEAGRVARLLTTAFSEALGLAPGFFTPYTDHSIDVLRMNHYALAEGTEVTAGLRGMGEHTDFGIVTVLWADPLPGLQVLGDDGVWHDVVPAEGALLVNLGDLTARWTNDRWRSTLHRVMPPTVDGRTVRRRSAAFFHDGNADARIETLASCRGTDGGSFYPPTTVAEHLEQKLGGSRAGYANRTAAREAERVRAARGDGTESA